MAHLRILGSFWTVILLFVVRFFCSVQGEKPTLWNMRTIPYVLDSAVSPELRATVREALNTIQSQSCLRFTDRQDESDFVHITFRHPGCNSLVGRQGGEQFLTLTDGCSSKGKVMHEMLHALGFYHEQARSDRNDFVTVDWSNIRTGHERNFVKVGEGEDDTAATPYDFGSIMHYRLHAFSKDPSRYTIVPKVSIPSGVVVGQRERLSSVDVLKLNRLYKCDVTSCPAPGVPENGVRNGTELSVGSSIFYACNLGYKLVGPWQRTCSMDGTWTGQTPRCFRDRTNIIHTCNFDKPNLCGWSQDKTDDLDWQWHHGRTPTDSTGPSCDHTLSSAYGRYLYLESSKPASVGNLARILSPVYTPRPETPNLCIRFHYHMYGDGVGTLSVRIQPPGSEDVTQEAWSQSGDQGDMWHTVSLSIKTNGQFRVVFTATRGLTYRGDIAIDDVEIAPCSVLHMLDAMLKQGVVVGRGPVKETTCSFNTDLCGWSRAADENAPYWQYTASNTQPSDQYLTVNTESLTEGRRTLLKSPRLMGGNRYCISFSYRVSAPHANNQLNVLVEPQDSSALTQLAWSQRGTNSNWRDVAFTLPVRLNSKVVLEAVGGAVSSTIDLDDVSVVPGLCNRTIRQVASATADSSSLFIPTPPTEDMIQTNELGPHRHTREPTRNAVTSSRSNALAGNGLHY